MNSWDIKATKKNLNRVFQGVWEHLPDDNGRGEIDENTGIMRCVEWVIEHLLECGEIKEVKK